MKLKDRVAIVTGGGTGIGKAISLAFADEGAAVVVAARNVARLEETASEIRAKAGKVKVIPTDIADYEQVKRMVAGTVEEFGKLDILINNAAAYSYNNADVPDMDLNVWQNTLEVNVTGTMLCAREAMKVMIPRQSGVIVNVSSVAGISGHPTESPYCVSKWGIIGFTEVLAIEAGKHNIRVNTISPGATRTKEFEEMIEALAERRGMSAEEMWRKLKAANSLNRIAEPEEIARAVVFMASDDSSAMTGHNMIVSCGFHLIHPQELHRL
ncbi:MAG TPA: SDR family oxidoreductase [Anaerolineae bacterium]|nr:SDR family oxidoreductase [Anaerolineae bacterium]